MNSHLPPNASRGTANALDTLYHTGEEDRRASVDILLRIAGPVIRSLATNTLRQEFPVHPWEGERSKWACAEAFARTLCGLAPWLELAPDTSPEGQQRALTLTLTRQAIHNAFNPSSADFLNWEAGDQMLVEAAFLSQALLRAPRQLWDALPGDDRSRIASALRSTRAVKPYANNWLLFSAMVETALGKFTGDFDRQPIETAVLRHMAWYVGDGTYGDGPEFHWDYYNSYVIHPMLLDVLHFCRDRHDPLGELLPVEMARARRYAQVQERMISPEGTFPLIGRSSIYRFGAFHLLSQILLLHQAPSDLALGPTRAALSAVIERMGQAPGTFDSQGWLQIGALGFQPEIRDFYNSGGSPYLTAVALAHLGLPASDPLWTDEGGPWTQRRIWAADQTVKGDHPYKEISQ